jgi:hypothetical protein
MVGRQRLGVEYFNSAPVPYPPAQLQSGLPHRYFDTNPAALGGRSPNGDVGEVNFLQAGIDALALQMRRSSMTLTADDV